MTDLPRRYARYLHGKDPAVVEAVRPVMEQSAAEGLYGVRIRSIPDGVQAVIDQATAYGTVTEGAD
ncbi:hypothetical protein [Sinomonas atrocyanea]